VKTDDYLEGFRDGMSCDQKYPQTLQVMGYSLEQIIELILNEEKANNYQWTEAEAKKLKARQKEINEMATILITRKEAEEKLRIAKIPKDIGGNYHIIDILEALGLLHIEEEEKPAIELFNPNTGQHYKVWADGRTEGTSGFALINRIPMLK